MSVKRWEELPYRLLAHSREAPVQRPETKTLGHCRGALRGGCERGLQLGQRIGWEVTQEVERSSQAWVWRRVDAYELRLRHCCWPVSCQHACRSTELRAINAPGGSLESPVRRTGSWRRLARLDPASVARSRRTSLLLHTCVCMKCEHVRQLEM